METTIYGAALRWADLTPENVAIVAPGGVALTYARLKELVDQLVKSIRAIGVGGEDRIAVVLPNGPAMVIAFLGASAAGVCAPLNPAYSETEFDFFLEDLKPKLLITDSSLESPALLAAQRRDIPLLTWPDVLVRDFLEDEEKRVAHPLFAKKHPKPDSTALLLYTSGTTAQPKRVPLTHANLLSSADSIREALRLRPADRCLNVMPLFHIHGLVAAMLSSLTAGSTIATPGRLDGASFFDWLEELQPTWYTAVPTIHQAVLGHAKDHRPAIDRSKLRLIRSSSAPLPPRVAAELEHVFKVPVIEAYGMTEASHQIASNPLPPAERKTGSVGRATGIEVAILDAAGALQEPGTPGEIALRGPTITRGYEDNSDANKQAFRDGWFRTGDQGHLDSEGYLYVTGRLKELINRGGEKISPREIDEALLSHPEVLHAAAFAVPQPSLGEEVAAAVVVRDKQSASELLIRRYLSLRLAAFKIPTRILLVDELPKGFSGKIQRHKLAQLVGQRRAEATAPRTDREAMVARIYEQVLGVQNVGAEDNFFELGGDSLRATQVISRIRSLFHVNLPIATVFWRASVRDLADEIARTRA